MSLSSSFRCIDIIHSVRLFEESTYQINNQRLWAKALIGWWKDVVQLCLYNTYNLQVFKITTTKVTKNRLNSGISVCSYAKRSYQFYI